MGRRRIGRALALVLALAPAARGAAQDGPVADPARLPFRVTADELSVDDDGVYEATGNVRVEQSGGRTLDADWVALNSETRVGVAVGNVVIRDADDVVHADFAAVNLDTLFAITTRASLDTATSGFAVSGDSLERTGASTYRVHNGTFTTCRCPPDRGRRPWEVEIDQADIRVGGYAVARDVTFRVLGLPVFYTPWLIFPVKTERQSGFLVPAVSRSSRGGQEIELPFFWALRENANVLLRPTYIADRGFKSGIEVDYVFGDAGFGSGGAAGLAGDDDVGDGDPAQRFSDDRWAYWLRHEQPLAAGTRFGLDVWRASDNQYPLDFEDLGRDARNSRFLESSAFFTAARSGVYGGLELSLIDDLQSPNDLDRDDFLLQRLPDVRVSGLPRRLGPLPLYGAFDLRYTYFHQDADVERLRDTAPVSGQFFDTGVDGLFDPDEPDASGAFGGADNHGDTFGPANTAGTELDGRFQEGELLADFGHRLDAYPRLSLPVRVGPVETFSEIGYRSTFYSPRHGDSEQRSLWTARFDARIRLARRYALGAGELQHVVEPRIAFGWLDNDEDQDELPLFIPRSAVRNDRLIDGDLRVLVRDPSDRLRDERFLQFVVANRLYAPRRAGEAARLIGDLRLGAGYDFEIREASDVFLRAGFYPHSRLQLRAALGYDPEAGQLDEADAVLEWRSEPRFALGSSVSDRAHSLELSYRYERDSVSVFEAFRRSDDVFEDFTGDLTRIDQFNLAANLALVRRLDLFGRGYLSLEESSASGGALGVALLSSCACWELIAAVERRTRPDDTRFTLEIRLAGLGLRPRTRGDPARRAPFGR